jgi:hypothetical protein
MAALKLGFIGPFCMLSLRQIRKGEVWCVNGVLLKVREDFTRWNSILWRCMWWWKGIAANRVNEPLLEVSARRADETRKGGDA